MDREQREQANRTLREKLTERLASGRIPLEDLMGRADEEEPEPHSNETGGGGDES